MKYFKIFLLAISFVTFMTACDEATTPTDNPEAPTALMATSTDATSVTLKFTPSTSESNAKFQGYQLSIDGVEQTSTIGKGQSIIKIDKLTEGTIYNFSIKAKYNDGSLSTPVSISWSPASRFIKNNNSDDIKVYESASDFGSGLELYYSTEKAPRIRKVANGADWDLGLDTRNSKVLFGSASAINYTYTGTPGTTEISTVVEANSLDDVYDSQALNTLTWTSKTVDLSQYNTDKSLVFYVREKIGTSYNYAKVQVIKKNSTFLQGASPNRYVQLNISYQTKADVPYAKFPTNN